MDLIKIEDQHKHWLSKLDEMVWAYLENDKTRLILQRFTSEKRQPEPTRTEGLSLDIATAFQGKSKVILQVWLQQYVQPGRLDLEYCIRFANARHRRSLMSSIGKGDLVYYQEKKLLNRLTKKNRKPEPDQEYEHLKATVTKKDRSNVILDQDWSDGDYLGKVIFPAPSIAREPSDKLAKEIAEFFSAVLTQSGEIVLDTVLGAVVDVEGKPVVRQVVRMERKSKFAMRRKRDDNFICQICGFDFAKTYPGIGKEFAEAHHKIPLSKAIGERKVSVQSFTTVCANCHRMLHWKKNRSLNSVKAAFERGKKLH